MNLAPEVLEDLARDEQTLIQLADLSEEEAASIPTWWAEVLALPEGDRMARAIIEWNRAVPNRFPKFLDHLARTGTGIYLVRDTNMRLHLLYVARDIDNQRPTCWAGSTPLAGDDPAIRTALPFELIRFHTTIHDAFRLADGWNNGWLPMSEMFAFSEYIDPDDSDLEFRGTPPDFDPHNVDFGQVMAVYIDSSYRYAVDISGSHGSSAGWYWVGGDLWPIANFWDNVDEFMLVATR